MEFEGRSKSLIYFLSSERESTHTIQELIEEMNAQEDGTAFFCEQPVFRKLYQARMRESRRLDINSYLLVLDVQGVSAELANQATGCFDSDCEESAALLRYFHPNSGLSVSGDVDAKRGTRCA